MSTDIEGTIVDDGYGIDQASVSVDVSTADGGDIPGSLNITGDFLDFTYSFNPDEDLPAGTEINVKVNAEDLADPPNVMDEFVYSFTTEEGEDPFETIEQASLGHIKAGFAE